MSTARMEATIDGPEGEKREWLGRLDSLVRDIKGWAEASGWRTRRIGKTLDEGWIGRYEVPVLLMEKNAVQVVLNPVARRVSGADGAVDLYLSPAYDDIATLYYEGGCWVVYYGGRPDPIEPASVVEITPRPYAEETIRAILDEMVPDA